MIAFDLPDVGPLDCATHIHLVTHHWNAPQMQTATPGVGVLCRRAYKPQQIGGVSLVRNSHGMPALYAFAGYQPLQVGGSVRVGAIAGLRTRSVFRTFNNYQWSWNPATFDHTDVVAFGAAVASWQFAPGAQAHLMLVPAIGLWTPATAGVSLSWDWK